MDPDRAAVAAAETLTPGQAVTAVELGIALVGAGMYWRAARTAAGPDRAMLRRANFCGAAVLTAGALTLGLHVLGL